MGWKIFFFIRESESDWEHPNPNLSLCSPVQILSSRTLFFSKPVARTIYSSTSRFVSGRFAPPQVTRSPMYIGILRTAGNKYIVPGIVFRGRAVVSNTQSLYRTDSYTSSLISVQPRRRTCLPDFAPLFFHYSLDTQYIRSTRYHFPYSKILPKFSICSIKRLIFLPFCKWWI